MEIRPTTPRSGSAASGARGLVRSSSKVVRLTGGDGRRMDGHPGASQGPRTIRLTEPRVMAAPTTTSSRRGARGGDDLWDASIRARLDGISLICASQWNRKRARPRRRVRCSPSNRPSTPGRCGPANAPRSLNLGRLGQPGRGSAVALYSHHLQHQRGAALLRVCY
jgi:hypothetical protein